MEDINKVNGCGENGGSSEGLPPHPRVYRQCLSAARVSPLRRKTLVRHPSLVSF